MDIGLKPCPCYFSPEGDVYKAQTPNTETQGVPEVTEDQYVQVEVPLDQVGSRHRMAVPTAFLVCSSSPACLQSHPQPLPQAIPGF